MRDKLCRTGEVYTHLKITQYSREVKEERIILCQPETILLYVFSVLGNEVLCFSAFSDPFEMDSVHKLCYLELDS